MKHLFTLLLILFTILANAQTNSLIVNSNIILPKDSVVSTKLTASINDFLISAQKPNEENKFVLDSEKVETFILLDEINGIEKSEEYKDDFFYKPYLTNLVELKNNDYLVQVSYIGLNENTPILRASFEFIAHKIDNSYKFSSPLIRNAGNWKVEKIGNEIFHFKKSINKQKIAEYTKLIKIL
jgi:hypothetical protein